MQLLTVLSISLLQIVTCDVYRYGELGVCVCYDKFQSENVPKKHFK